MKKLPKTLKLALLSPVLLCALSGCGNSSNLMVKALRDAVVELPTITSIDYGKGLKKSKDMFGKFGCSGIGKVLEDGEMIVGRSFDLYYSNNPAYLIRTEVRDCYKTIGLSYNTFDGKDFETIKKSGVTQDELLTLLFFTADVMNEKGLYIEANMRDAQPSSAGIQKSTGTNPNAELSMFFPALVRYLGERCANVSEAVAMATHRCIFFDIFSKYGRSELTFGSCQVDNLLYGDLPKTRFSYSERVGEEGKKCDCLFKRCERA